MGIVRIMTVCAPNRSYKRFLNDVLLRFTPFYFCTLTFVKLICLIVLFTE